MTRRAGAGRAGADRVCPVVGRGFLWDDDQDVFADETLRDAAGLRAIWADPLTNQQYDPLTYTSFWLETQAFAL